MRIQQYDSRLHILEFTFLSFFLQKLYNLFILSVVYEHLIHLSGFYDDTIKKETFLCGFGRNFLICCVRRGIQSSLINSDSLDPKEIVRINETSGLFVIYGDSS